MFKWKLCHRYAKVPKRNYLVFFCHSKCVKLMVLATSKWYSVSIEIFDSILWWSLHQCFLFFLWKCPMIFCVHLLNKTSFLIYVHTKESRGIRSSECNEAKLTLHWSSCQATVCSRIWCTILLEHNIQFMLY
jgi:hypothetical protein